MEFNKKQKWLSHTGEKSFEEFDNTHIANLLFYLRNARYYKLVSDIEFINGLADYAVERGLSKDFLDKAPYKYKDLEGNEFITDRDNPNILYQLNKKALPSILIGQGVNHDNQG